MNMNPPTRLLALNRSIAKLEAQLARQNRKLSRLPAKFGFDSMAAFIAALQAAGQTQPKAKRAGRRRRAKITPQTKAKVKALVGQGKTGGAIAKALGISVPSVQKIKLELGLAKKRG